MPVALLPRPITVRSAPPLEPPFDDETSPAVRVLDTQPMLPLDWSQSRNRRPAPLLAVWTADDPPRSGRPRSAASPARGATMHFLSLCLEVLNGFRPLWHLRPLTAPAEFTEIAEELTRALRRVPTGSDRRRVRLRELRVCEPRPGIAEAAAVLGHGDRAWAMALRLERRPAGWLCTLAEVL